MTARLAQLKRDYLSLSEADRAAFSEWHDGVIRDQRRAAAHASSSAVSAVLLSGGTGKRARLNGVRATLVAGSRRSGWVDVIPHDATCAIPWRQGGATPAPSVGEAPEASTASAGTLILLLADDQLVEIAKGLDTPSVCNFLRACKRLGALEPGRCFTECHLREGLPRGYGVVPSKQLRFARWLASVHAPMRTLHVDLGHGSAEGNVLRWLLQECDTQELTTVKVRIGSGRVGHMTRALYSGSVVLTADESALTADDVAVEAQLAPFEGADEGLLTCVLARTCPALTSLYINDQKDDLKDVPSLGSIKTLRRLETNLGEVRMASASLSALPRRLAACFFWQWVSFSCDLPPGPLIFQADDASYLCEELPLLTHLTLLGGQQGSLYGGRLDLQSESLEVIDISNSAKQLTFERLDCPSLRELRCSEMDGYGNGLIPRDPTGDSGTWWYRQERPGPGVCDQPCKFTQMPFRATDQQPGSLLIDLPEQCVVYWSSHRHGEVRATSTTTYGELYDQIH